MKFEDIISELKQKKYQPVYFLTGEQNYYIDFISDYIEKNVLTEAEKGFNLSILYGKECNAKDIAIKAKQYPMMSAYQVIIIKEAQELSNIDALEDYINNPLDSTILVICYKHKKLDGRKAIAKALKNHTVYFETPRVYDNQIPDWIINYLHKKGRTITPKAAILMANSLGIDLQKIANELEKLLVAVPQKITIDVEHIEKYIGISKDYNVFELQNALGKRNKKDAFRIVYYFAENEKAGPMPMITILLYKYFANIMKLHFLPSKSRSEISSALGINPFFVSDYLDASKNYHPKQISKIFQIIQDYDLKSKGYKNTSTTQGELLKEMIYKIINI